MHVILLLLVQNDSPRAQPDHTPSQNQSSITQLEPELGPEDDSLLTFGSDDEEFDPLKRSDSLVTKRTESFTSSQTSTIPGRPAIPTSNPSSNQTILGTGQSTTEPAGSHLLGDLTGIDMSKTSPMSTPPLSHREQQMPRYDLLQPLQPNMATATTMTSSSTINTPITRGSGLVATANMGSYPAQGAMMTHGGVLYAPVAQPTYGMGVVQGGAVMQQVPVMYMQVGGQRMPYAGQVCI